MAGRHTRNTGTVIRCDWAIYFLLLGLFLVGWSQQARTQEYQPWSSSEIGLNLKKLEVLGSVLYVAAHPDDENTRLLAYLARHKMYRSGYLSITRGDGGQNLIGDEQGVDLGLIRTQELLAARRLDGAEQFFTRAFDFGFSKSTEEALRFWDEDKILADVVWVIRSFKPDIIIVRFPEDNRAGHGHHSASAVLARKGFLAAADPTRYPEQFKLGVSTWQARRILWNTYNFGSTNTISNNQFKLDAGPYDPLTGRSIGEMAAESRSQHKSQGFGVPSSRGMAMEYFQPLLGDTPVNDLMDGIVTSWDRVDGSQGIAGLIGDIRKQFDYANPSASVPGLIKLYQRIEALPASYWKTQKLNEVLRLIERSSGLYAEASTPQEYAVLGDSLRINLQVNNRSGVKMKLNKVTIGGTALNAATELAANRNWVMTKTIHVSASLEPTQPYWLEENMKPGHFVVSDLQRIGQPENPPAMEAVFELDIEGTPFRLVKGIQYKHTDPVKGELFQPLYVVPAVTLQTNPGVLVFPKNSRTVKNIQITATAKTNMDTRSAKLEYQAGTVTKAIPNLELLMSKGGSQSVSVHISARDLNGSSRQSLHARLMYKNDSEVQIHDQALAKIDYDHIPSIRYFYPDSVTLLHIDVKTSGRRVGYIRGAGDKVPEALEQLGFQVTYLDEEEIVAGKLGVYDAIVAGVRAYNVHPWLASVNGTLMEYVRQGGNFVVQYNTNSFAGPMQATMGPAPFQISRERVTDEQSDVKFLAPTDDLLQKPNKISAADFEGWVQERGVYFADRWQGGFTAILSMRDPGEQEDQQGSLIVSRHGKGRFIYTGLAFFRQLPAGVPGAYRLFANIVSNPNLKINDPQ